LGEDCQAIEGSEDLKRAHGGEYHAAVQEAYDLKNLLYVERSIYAKAQKESVRKALGQVIK